MNRDDPPKSLDQPWWLGKAKRQPHSAQSFL